MNNNNNELVTRAVLGEELDKLKTELTSSLTSSLVPTLTSIFKAAITEAVDGLARLVNKSFMEQEMILTRKFSEELGATEGRLTARLDAMDARLNPRLDDHELRITALERGGLHKNA